jgi:hypothetical protein
LVCPQNGKVPRPKSTSTVTPFYKGESQEKNISGDWKEQKYLPCFPAHVMLGGSGVFGSWSIHALVVTALLDSEAKQAAWLNRVNHSSI